VPPTDYGILMPWMPDELIQIYNDAYVEYGDPDFAWAAVRQSPAYDQYFAGNRREDGTVRMTEQEYVAVKEGYNDVFLSVGLNPKLFEEQYLALIEGDVSPDELMRDRVLPVYERILEATPDIMARYANDWGLEMTPAAILAAALDPDGVGTQILNKQIALSEIGGEAAESGYNIDIEYAERLQEAGLDRGTADQLFSKAENMMPVLQTLAARHADPDDTFDLEEFVSGELFQDPKERRRVRRLMAQESSTFTGGAQLDYVRSRTGGVAGLADL
jgi:hypothetical protein